MPRSDSGPNTLEFSLILALLALIVILALTGAAQGLMSQLGVPQAGF